MRVEVATFRPGIKAVMAGAPASAAEDALLAACKTGEVAVAGDGVPPDTTDPARRVRAGLIRYLLLGGDSTHRPHPKGMRLRGAWIDGVLDLEGCASGLDLTLKDCLLPHALRFQDARLGGLYLPGCRAEQGLDLTRATIAANVFLSDGFHASAPVVLCGARVTGQLACTGGRFEGGSVTAPDGSTAPSMALNCDAVTVGADVFLRGKFHASGAVNLRGARITGQLDCTDGQFDGGSVTLADGSTALGMALNCNAVRVGADVFLTDGFHASGEVNLVGASITGQLGCDGGQFVGGKVIAGGSIAPGMALNCNGVTVGADVFLRGGFHSSGEVNLTGARITGQLDCTGGRFEGGSIKTPGIALNCNGVTVGASVFLSDGFHASGEINLRGASITSQLACVGGRLDGGRVTAEDGSTRPGTALDCNGVTVGASVFLSDRFHASGEVNFVGATITGHLLVRQARFDGGIDLRAAQVDGVLSCAGVTGVQVQGPYRSTDPAPHWPGLPDSIARVDLTEARVGSLRDEAGGWEAVRNLRLSGFAYQRLGQGPDLGDRMKWLARGDDSVAVFDPQPYSQLARVLSAAGQRRAAARVRVARERKLRRAEWQRAWATLPWRGRLLGALGAYLWSGVYGALFGYGHAPARVLWYVAGLIGITGLFFGHVYALGQFAPNSAVILTSDDWLAAVARSDLACALASNCVKPLQIWAGVPDLLPPQPPAVDYESFSPGLYAIDLFLPLDTIGQTEAWAPSRDRGDWGKVAYYARMPIQLVGWLIVAVTAAVLTGLVGKHDD